MKHVERYRQRLAAATFLLIAKTFLAANGNPQNIAALPEDKVFWNRFLQDDSQLSIPTADPTASTTESEELTLPPTREHVACSLSITIGCRTTNNTECREIGPLPSNCTLDKLNEISFSFQGGICNPNGNNQGPAAFCEDFDSVNFSESVIVFCFDEFGFPLIVEPNVVEPEGTFVVSNPSGSGLSTQVECDILSNDGMLIQQNIIDASGNVPLQLNDIFGSLRLESCDESSCDEILIYNITTQNTGIVDINITKIEFDLNMNVVHILPEPSNRNLSPSDFKNIEYTVEVDVCRNVAFLAFVDVEANINNGDTCQDEDSYTIIVGVLPTVQPSNCADNKDCCFESPDCTTENGEILGKWMNYECSENKCVLDPEAYLNEGWECSFCVPVCPDYLCTTDGGESGVTMTRVNLLAVSEEECCDTECVLDAEVEQYFSLDWECGNTCSADFFEGECINSESITSCDITSSCTARGGEEGNWINYDAANGQCIRFCSPDADFFIRRGWSCGQQC